MKRIYFIGLVFCLAMLIWQILSRRNEYAVLKERGKITNAAVAAFTGMSRFKYGVNYSFSVDKKRYKQEDERTELDYKYFHLFEGRIFPVIYDPEDPKVSHMILTKSDFTYFQVPIPDTLKNLIDNTE